MKNSDFRKDSRKDNIIVHVATGIIVGAVLFVALTLAFALLSFKTDIGNSMYLPAELVIGGVSGLVSGFVTVRPVKRLAAPLGACSGLGMSAILSLIMIIFNGAASPKPLLMLCGVNILLASLGGVAAANMKKKMRY